MGGLTGSFRGVLGIEAASMRGATVVPAEVLAVGRQRILAGARLGETAPEHSSAGKSGSILAVTVSEGRQPRAFGRGGACVQPERTQP
ncbi:putative proline-rich receptor-like protein kinase PERK2 [Iris pallida]|uniref:Proline-rich receptor-like protein kinase PERK2 n=1 Tax=Iris pallida TaxID=29817 RepID=A0AAX6F6V9_IRIPA|nr:putative proline-rich receptor-like protein kinase PERK2 [Iris pallida]